jgi:hypothetical protein
MLSFGLYSLIRRNPRDVLLSSLPDLRTNMVDWQKYAMVKALLMLHKELPGVFFDGDPLFADVGPVLRDFVRALQPVRTSRGSRSPIHPTDPASRLLRIPRRRMRSFQATRSPRSLRSSLNCSSSCSNSSRGTSASSSHAEPRQTRRQMPSSVAF